MKELLFTAVLLMFVMSVSAMAADLVKLGYFNSFSVSGPDPISIADANR